MYDITSKGGAIHSLYAHPQPAGLCALREYLLVDQPTHTHGGRLLLLRWARHREMRAFFPAWPGKQSRVISPNSIGGFTPFTPRSGLQEIPVATRQESGVLFFPSRRGLTLRVSRECNPEIPVGPVVEH